VLTGRITRDLSLDQVLNSLLRQFSRQIERSDRHSAFVDHADFTFLAYFKGCYFQCWDPAWYCWLLPVRYSARYCGSG